MVNEISEEMRKHTFSEDKLNKIIGRTGEIIEYKDYLTNEDVTYFLLRGDELTDARCPIDKTQLIYMEVSQVWAGYRCPNCENTFNDVSKKGLELEYKEILNSKKEKLKKIEEEKSNLIKIINRLEE